MNKIIVNPIQGCANMWYITTKWSFVPGMKVVLTSENLSIQCTTLTVKRKSMMGKNSTWQKLIHTRRRQWHPTPILLPGKSHGRGNLVGCPRVGHDWETSLLFFTFMHWRRKWQPTPVFLPGESQGRGSLVGCRLWGLTESDTTEAT